MDDLLNHIKERLEHIKPGSSALLAHYDEEHRYYHNMDHVTYVVDKIYDNGHIENTMLFLAAVFHDVIYDPKSPDNELNSAKLFARNFTDVLTDSDVNTVCSMIMDTQTHEPSSAASEALIHADMSILDSDFATLLKYEHAIFKEFQFVDWTKYREKRIEFLAKHYNRGSISSLLQYVSNRQPKIGLYPGSFMPFHRGHLDVLEQAERVFDKVIVAYGKNPEKSLNVNYPTPKKLRFRQVDAYNCMLTNQVKSYGYEVTLVRGLRKGLDLSYETTQLQYMRDMGLTCPVVFFNCTPEHRHLSSTAIRVLDAAHVKHDYAVE